MRVEELAPSLVYYVVIGRAREKWPIPLLPLPTVVVRRAGLCLGHESGRAAPAPHLGRTIQLALFVGVTGALAPMA